MATSAVKSWSEDLADGLDALSRGDFETARNRFAKAHEKAPDEPMLQYALGRELARCGDFDSAKPLLLSAWTADRSLIGAAATLARGLGLDQRDFDGAFEILESARNFILEHSEHSEHSELEAAEHQATLEIVRGELLIETGDFVAARSAAARAAGRAFDNEPSEAIALGASAIGARADNLEGVAHANGGRHDAALFCFRRAQIADSEWPAPHINSALSFEALGRTKAAIQSATRALALNPGDSRSLALRARLLVRTGNAEAATAELAAALEKRPNDKRLTLLFADLLHQQGDASAASASIADLLAHDPTDAEVWLRLGATQLSSDAIGSAEECFRQTLELDPFNRDALTLLADLLVREGRLHEALAVAERAQALELGQEPEPELEVGLASSAAPGYRHGLNAPSQHGKAGKPPEQRWRR